MKRKSSPDREHRLAAALKENLKRRKAQARAKASGTGLPPTQGPGAALEAGPEDHPQPGPKTAPKRI
jgi:hypothetical protein